MLFVGHPDRIKLSSTQQAGQRHGITPIGLHLIARPSGHHRRRNNDTGLSELGQETLKPVAARPRLITPAERGAGTAKPLDQTAHSIILIRDRTVEANLTATLTFGDRHRDSFLMHVQPDVFGTFCHRLSPLL